MTEIILRGSPAAAGTSEECQGRHCSPVVPELGQGLHVPPMRHQAAVLEGEGRENRERDRANSVHEPFTHFQVLQDARGSHGREGEEEEGDYRAQKHGYQGLRRVLADHRYLRAVAPLGDEHSYE
eukprot:CAMPEP_0179317658 /NCGR_PEP_ID=MMETSP0797-20121207/56406_1 /TAXON_ID=47934 /ORGANISM="Dinophysis acuminata, Strain DAEP01" /LENGTH=124 /DNA_ID=CAMNT_0021028651 /DNA_START=139 /DNA_END=513 /DNA_ORIENTATION=+